MKNLLLLLALIAPATHAACNQSTLTGDYAISIIADDAGDTSTFVGIFNFDGVRKVKIVQLRVHFFGFRSTAVSGGGAYTVKDNCMVVFTTTIKQTGEKLFWDGALISPSEMKLAVSQSDAFTQISGAGEAKKLSGL